MKNHLVVPLLFVTLFFLTASCGPTKKELAARQWRIIKLKNRQAKLREQFERRIATGKDYPNKPDDPGYMIVECILPKKLPSDSPYIKGLPYILDDTLSSNVICANTTQGGNILKWRKWYCYGDTTNCTYSTWKNGQPTFDRILNHPVTIKFAPGYVMKFGPVAR